MFLKILCALFSDSPVPSSCNDTLSLSSPTSESDTSLMSSKRWPIDNSFLMSRKRKCTDEAILTSTQNQHIDDSSSQAKEVLFSVEHLSLCCKCCMFWNNIFYYADLLFSYSCCQACQESSGTKAWRGEDTSRICHERVLLNWHTLLSYDHRLQNGCYSGCLLKQQNVYPFVVCASSACP